MTVFDMEIKWSTVCALVLALVVFLAVASELVSCC